MKTSLTTLVGIKTVTVTIASNATKILDCRCRRVITTTDFKGTRPEPRVEERVVRQEYVIFAAPDSKNKGIHLTSVISAVNLIAARNATMRNLKRKR